MTVRHGKEGKVKFSTNAVAEIVRASVNEQVAVGDTTAMGDSWQTHVAGIPSWTADIECRHDPDDTNGQAAATIGSEVTLGVYLQGDDNGRNYVTGTATIISKTKEGSFDGVPTFSFQVQGNGALTESTVGA